MLRIPLDFSPDACYKGGRFSKTLLKEDFEFVSSKKDSTDTFNLSFVLLPAKIDPIPEKQSCEGDALRIRNINHIKIVLILSIKVVALYIRAIII